MIGQIQLNLGHIRQRPNTLRCRGNQVIGKPLISRQLPRCPDRLGTMPWQGMPRIPQVGVDNISQFRREKCALPEIRANPSPNFGDAKAAPRGAAVFQVLLQSISFCALAAADHGALAVQPRRLGLFLGWCSTGGDLHFDDLIRVGHRTIVFLGTFLDLVEDIQAGNNLAHHRVFVI